MKKVFKKVVAVVMLVGIMVGCCACGKQTCDFCGEEKWGCEERTILGSTVYVCKDCKAELNSISDGLSGLFGD